MTSRVDHALALIALRTELASFVGPVDEGEIEVAEARLGLRFPPSYRAFVAQLGAGSFGSTEFYGIIPSPVRRAVPDAVWVTEQARAEWGLLQPLIVVWFDGAGSYGALDTSNTDEHGEAPMVSWHPGLSVAGDRLELLAPDFGTFMLSAVGTEMEGVATRAAGSSTIRRG